MENNKIGAIEAIGLVLIISTTHILLNLPITIIKSTGASAIINVVYVFAIIIALNFLVVKLFRKFPNSDILDISEFLGGKFLKILVGAFLIIYTIFIAGTLIRSFSEGLKLIYLLKTPTIYIVLAFIIALVISNKLGFKTIIKCNLVFIPLILLSIVVIFFASSKNFDYYKMFPILGYGFKETFLTGSSNIFAFSGVAILLFIGPFLKNHKDYSKVSFTAIIITGIYLILGVSAFLFLFPFINGSETNLPIYLITKNVELSKFFQRADMIFMFIWMLSVYSYLSVISNFILHAFKKMTNIKSGSSMIYCLAAFIFSMAIISKNLATIKFLESVLYKYLAVSLVFVFCVLILIFAAIKKKKQVSSS